MLLVWSFVIRFLSVATMQLSSVTQGHSGFFGSICASLVTLGRSSVGLRFPLGFRLGSHSLSELSVIQGVFGHLVGLRSIIVSSLMQ